VTASKNKNKNKNKKNKKALIMARILCQFGAFIPENSIFEVTLNSLHKLAQPAAVVFGNNPVIQQVCTATSRHTAPEWQSSTRCFHPLLSFPLTIGRLMADPTHRGEEERLLGQNPQYGSVLASPLEGAAVDRSESNGEQEDALNAVQSAHVIPATSGESFDNVPHARRQLGSLFPGEQMYTILMDSQASPAQRSLYSIALSGRGALYKGTFF
jgi:hypothetical protein